MRLCLCYLSPLLPRAYITAGFFFFFCVRCDDCAKSSGEWLLGSPPSAVVRQLALKACPLLPRAYITAGFFFFFSWVRCDDRAKSSGEWLLGSPPSAVVWQLALKACPLLPRAYITAGFIFFFSWVRCDDCAKSSGGWLLGSSPSAVVWQLAPRAWCPIQCLLAKTVGVLSPGVGRSEECAQEFAPESHIHSGLLGADTTTKRNTFDITRLCMEWS